MSTGTQVQVFNDKKQKEKQKFMIKMLINFFLDFQEGLSTLKETRKVNSRPPEKTRKQEISSLFYLLIPATVRTSTVQNHFMIVALLFHC